MWTTIKNATNTWLQLQSGRRASFSWRDKESKGDRWSLDWPEHAPPSADGLGDHAAARFRHFRRLVEKMDEGVVDYAFFGLLLSAESLRDEMRAYEQQPSRLQRLAQTGHFVRQLQRLHGMLDMAMDEYKVDESPDMKNWRAALDNERRARAARYNGMLALAEVEEKGATNPLLGEIESEEQQEEAMALLKAAVDKYGDDLLTSEELEVTKKAFSLVVHHSGMVAVSLPAWFVMPFEFSGTFGLSRWGNDVLVPEHSDMTRFIKEANTWSELNHPHIAKFLGACHVSSRPFIAHEKVRTLREYLSETNDRQHVWQRLYEIALALQYLRERGLACGQLGLKNVYCTQFDTKAMVFGIGLIDCGDSSALHRHEDESSDEDRVSDRCPLAASDIEALLLLSLECLRAISPSESAATHSKTQGDRFASGNSDQTRRMPATRPNFVQESEWKALMKMRKANPTSSGAILSVIEHFKELAGISGQEDWFGVGGAIELQLRADAGPLDIGAIEVPAVGRTIAEIISRCADTTFPEDPESHIQARLADIHAQLAVMDFKGVDASIIKGPIEHFATLLVRLQWFLEQKEGVDGSSRALPPERVPVSLFAFHSDIDRLMESSRLSSTSEVHLWKPKWELLSSRHQFVALSKLIRHSSPHFPIVKEEEEEDKTQSLSFNQVGMNALAALRSSQKMLLEHRKRTNGMEEEEWRRGKLPRWFLAPTEVDFKSFAEFSRGAFGSVHLGKWFDTRVVVKRVFMDVDDRATIQAQFRREADVWFKLNHINVVKMYGACHLDQPFFVCEYASGGNLDSYLKKEGRDPRLMRHSLLNAALGLQYLHDNGVVHADLKADNILVGADGVPKLTDFGLSVSARRHGADEASGALGAYRWKAPECLPSKGRPGKVATFASDVYSFAMVMIEIVSGDYPWGGSMPDAAVAFHVKRGKLPARPAEFADSEWRLIERMCCLDPAERVTIDVVVLHLSSLIERLDLDEMWSMVYGAKPSRHKNRVVSRGGALLSLLDLAKSANSDVGTIALDHLFAVSIDRGVAAGKEEIEAIVQLLKQGKVAHKAWAASALQEMTPPPISAFNSALIAEAGAIPVLVKLARHGNQEQKTAAIGALTNLSISSDNKALIVSAGGISTAMRLIRKGDDEQKDSGASVLWNLAFKNAPIAAQIVRKGGVRVLVRLLIQGNEEQKISAAGALGFLEIDQHIKTLVAENGGVAALVDYLGDCRYQDDKEETLVALRNVCCDGNAAARKALLAADGVAALSEVVQSGNSQLVELAIAIISNVAAK